MAIPLRIIQEFYREEDGTRTYTKYRLETKVYGNWKEVPVVMREVARPEKRGVDIRVGGEYVMEC
jgi:hypothetical protein